MLNGTLPAARWSFYDRLLALVDSAADTGHLLKLKVLQEVLAFLVLVKDVAKPVMHAHILELETLSEYVILLKEVVGLRNYAFYKLLTFNHELFVVFSELQGLCLVPNVLKLPLRVDQLGHEFEYFLSISKCAVKPLSSINHN